MNFMLFNKNRLWKIFNRYILKIDKAFFVCPCQILLILENEKPIIYTKTFSKIFNVICFNSGGIKQGEK